MGNASAITPSEMRPVRSQLSPVRRAKMYVRFLRCGYPYSALFTTRHSTEYPSSLRQERMIAKSRPRCDAGLLSRRSTFSNST